MAAGGIYAGFFPPVEAAGVGAAFALGMLVVRKQASLANLKSVVMETLQTSGMCFLILIGASAFSPFIALSELPRDTVAVFAGLDLGPYGTMILLLRQDVLQKKALRPARRRQLVDQVREAWKVSVHKACEALRIERPPLHPQVQAWRAGRIEAADQGDL